MNIYILLAQRKCSYPGEYAPECLDCMSEFCFDDNPDFLIDKLVEYRQSGDFESVELAQLDLSDQDVKETLFPAHKVIPSSLVRRLET